MGLAFGLGCALGALLASDAGQASWEAVFRGRTLDTKQAEALDWKVYYRNEGFIPSIDGRWIQSFSSPSMQWYVPSSILNGPPVGPPGLPPGFSH